MYRPAKSNQMTTSMQLLVPKKPTETVLGVAKKEYVDDLTFSCNFSTYGGTESVSNDVLSVIDTAEVICWYNPRITSGCRVRLLSNNAEYEIVGEPENLEMRNMLMQFKIRRVKGGA